MYSVCQNNIYLVGMQYLELQDNAAGMLRLWSAAVGVFNHKEHREHKEKWKKGRREEKKKDEKERRGFHHRDHRDTENRGQPPV